MHNLVDSVSFLSFKVTHGLNTRLAISSQRRQCDLIKSEHSLCGSTRRGTEHAVSIESSDVLRRA